MSFKPLIFFCALACEAKELIAHFKLKQDLKHKAFDVFHSPLIYLVKTQVGELNMASAVSYSFSQLSLSSTSFCINFGIAGHATSPLGSLFMAHKVSHTLYPKCYYPHLPAKLKLASLPIMSATQPQGYSNNNPLLDMEAYAFFHTALKFTSLENLFSIKLVSDNQDSHFKMLKASQVEALIKERFQDLIATIDHLLCLQQTLSIPEKTFENRELEKMPYTHSQRLQLSQLMEQCHHLNLPLPKPSTPLSFEDFYSALSLQLQTHMQDCLK